MKLYQKILLSIAICSFSNTFGVEQSISIDAIKANLRTAVNECKENPYGDSSDKSFLPLFSAIKWSLMLEKAENPEEFKRNHAKKNLLTILKASQKEETTDSDIGAKIGAFKTFCETFFPDEISLPMNKPTNPLFRTWLLYAPQDKSGFYYSEFAGSFETIKGTQTWIRLLKRCFIDKLIDKKLKKHRKANQRILSRLSFRERFKYHLFTLLYSSAILRRLFGDKIKPIDLPDLKDIKKQKDLYVDFFLKNCFDPLTAYHFMYCFEETSFFYEYSIGWLEALLDDIWYRLSEVRYLGTDSWYKAIPKYIIHTVFDYLPRKEYPLEHSDLRYEIRVAAKKRLEQLQDEKELASLGPISLAELKECRPPIHVTPLETIPGLVAHFFGSVYWMGACVLVLYYIANYFLLLTPEETI